MNGSENLKELVNALFATCEPTEEVCAARDEVLNNCAEHYEDLISSGMDETAALQAIAESLRGMEEVARSYPQKKPKEIVSAEAEPNGNGAESESVDHKSEQLEIEYSYAADEVNRIRTDAKWSDVSVFASPDDRFHVKFSDRDTAESCSVNCRNGELTLCINERKNDEYFGNWNGKVDTGRGAMGHLASALMKLADMIQGAGSEFHSGNHDARITLLIPSGRSISLNVQTTSGDVVLGGLSFENAVVRTTSGDIKAEQTSSRNDLELSTTSGDVKGEICACRNVRAGTVSGDVRLTAAAEEEVNVGTVSGDLDLNAAGSRCSTRSVSGDIAIRSTDPRLKKITATSVSGDIQVKLPAGMRASVYKGNRDARTCEPQDGLEADKLVFVQVSTVSGDIEIN